MQLEKVSQEAMKAVIQSYTVWERDIVILYFGLDDGFTCSVEDIADLCGVSRQKVIDVAQRALDEGRRLMEGDSEGLCVCPMLPGGIIEHTSTCAYMKQKR